MSHALLFASGTLCAGLWALLTAVSRGLPAGWCQRIDALTGGVPVRLIRPLANGFYYDVPNNDMPTLAFLVIFFLIFIIVFFVTCRLIRRPSTDRRAAGVVFGFAVLFRLILLPGEPVHENDFYRYLWDGTSFVHGINPYKYAPSDLFMVEHGLTEDVYDESYDVTLRARDFSAEEKEQVRKLIRLRDENPQVYHRIGHRQVPTIYPPFVQLVFAASAAVKADSIAVMKFIFMLFDLGTLLLVMRLLVRLGRDPALGIVYGWSPLVLKEFANSGHYDPVAVFFMMLGAALITGGRPVGGAAAAAVSFLSKFFGAVLMPVLHRRLTRRAWVMFLAVSVGAYLPFFVWDHAGVRQVFAGLLAYQKEWAYTPSIFAVIYAALKALHPSWAESYIPAKMACGLVYSGILVYLSRRPERDPESLLRRCFFATGALFLCSPVGDPWYFCWVMPLLCLFPYRSWLLLSGLLALSYLNFRSDIPWTDEFWAGIPALSWVIYGPFALAGMLEYQQGRRSATSMC